MNEMKKRMTLMILMILVILVIGDENKKESSDV